jgi:hypothetical protein
MLIHNLRVNIIPLANTQQPEAKGGRCQGLNQVILGESSSSLPPTEKRESTLTLVFSARRGEETFRAQLRRHRARELQLDDEGAINQSAGNFVSSLVRSADGTQLDLVAVRRLPPVGRPSTQSD